MWEDVVALIGKELKFGRGKMRDMEEKYLNEKPLIKNENPNHSDDCAIRSRRKEKTT
jgi:hypothetical protein